MASRTFPPLVVLGSPLAFDKFTEETTMYSPLYLGCAPQGSEFENHIKFDFKASDPAATFAIEPDTVRRGFVHIKSYDNNKYWCRKDERSPVIVAEASEPVRDESTWKCTLFEIKDSNRDSWKLEGTSTAGKRRVVFHHLQTKHFLHIANSTSRNFLTTDTGGWMEAECVLVDHASLVTLPKRVVFKGHNGKYLTAAAGDRAPMVFTETDLSSESIVHEVYQTGDNLVRFKNLKTNQFWLQKYDQNVVTDDRSNASNMYSYFEIVKENAEDCTIALRYVRENKYCRADGSPLALKTTANTMTNESLLQVVEPVTKRTIKELRYHLDQVKIRDQSPDTLAVASAENRDRNQIHDLKLDKEVEYTESSTWTHTAGVMVGIETSFTSGIPRIAEANFTVKAETKYEHQWGKTKEDKQKIIAGYTMKVEPRTKGTIKLVAKKSTCDFPFSYRQIDILSNGERVETVLDNGVYKGVQYHEFVYEASSVSLDNPNVKSTIKAGHQSGL